MAFCGEVHNGIDLKVLNSLRNGLCITDVSLDKVRSLTRFQSRKARSISRVSKRIKGNNRVFRVGFTPVIDEISTNKSGGTRDQK